MLSGGSNDPSRAAAGIARRFGWRFLGGLQVARHSRLEDGRRNGLLDAFGRGDLLGCFGISNARLQNFLGQARKARVVRLESPSIAQEELPPDVLEYSSQGIGSSCSS
jgi:hypothetical protein